MWESGKVNRWKITWASHVWEFVRIANIVTKSVICMCASALLNTEVTPRKRIKYTRSCPLGVVVRVNT